jgi:hypothetical protein
MKITSYFSASRIILASFLFCASVSARVLDDFNDNTKTSWQDFAFPVGVTYSSVVEQDGQLKFALQPVGQSIFAASTKTSETFDLKEGRTIEFRVDLVSGNGPDSFAVLAFIPTTSSVSSLAGYGFAKSTTDILVTKALDEYFYNENPSTPIKNDNVTLSLSLTVKNGNVIINSRVLDKDAGNAVLFDKTFVDTPAADVLEDGNDSGAPYLGSGNFVLMCYEDTGTTQESYEVAFDNAQTFVTDTTVLDDFNDNTKTDWQDFEFPVGVNYADISEQDGQFKFVLQPVGQPIFAASTKTSRTFDLVEGERVEFRVDLVSGNGSDAFAVLAFIPTSSSVQSLAGYGFTKSTTDILVSKALDEYFYNENPAEPIKNDNITMVLGLTVIGGSVYIDAKVLDKDANNAVIFEKTFVDTPQADVLEDGIDKGPPYLGSGNFVLLCYEDDGKTQASYEVTFDNAEVSAAPVAANTAPIISDLSPASSSIFLPSSTTLSFKVTDDKPLSNTNIVLKLNGTSVTNGLSITGTGNSRTVSYSGLTNDITYTADIQVTDSEGLSSQATSYFDTFTTNNFIVEVEDYNFGGGQFIDDPEPIAENGGPQPTGYANQAGLAGIDFSDTRTDFKDVPYRPDDNVRMQHTLDFPRDKFVQAGGAAAFVYDYDVSDISAGEWLNYTRNFEAGSYQVYLREALRNAPQAQSALEEVTSDPSQPDQTTAPLGTFLAQGSGFQFRNVPLTDALGNPVVLNLSGETTLRLSQVTGEPSDGAIYQNYLIFVPVEDIGTRRPAVANVSPVGGSTVETVAPAVTANIVNRDTSVAPGSVKLYVNGSLVIPLTTNTASGLSLGYTLTNLPPSGSSVTARLEFADTENVKQTNQWTFTITYKSLDSANRAAGSGLSPGFNVHLVQAPSDNGLLDNSLSRAEDQLAPNSVIPRVIDTNTFAQVVNFNQFDGDAGIIPGDQIVPGLEPDVNGDDNFAVEIEAYLDLSAGTHRFGVNTDDGFKISSGASLNDKSVTPLDFHSGGPANQTFDFFVPEAGLYPFRMVWYERSGGASAEWYSIDPGTGTTNLINDPSVPNAVKAYTAVSAPAITLQSASVVNGLYAAETSATFDTGAGTITIPIGTTGSRFYRLSAGAAQKITAARVSGGKLVLNYQAQN